MENEGCRSAMETTQGISRPKIQRKLAPLDIARYEIDHLTHAIKKTFAKIITDYNGKTIIPPIEPGEELEGKNPSTHKG